MYICMFCALRVRESGPSNIETRPRGSANLIRENNYGESAKQPLREVRKYGRKYVYDVERKYGEKIR